MRLKSVVVLNIENFPWGNVNAEKMNVGFFETVIKNFRLPIEGNAKLNTGDGIFGLKHKNSLRRFARSFDSA